MSKAITEDVVMAARIASFYPLDEKARNDIVRKISDTMVELGAKHNFLVYRVSMETKNEADK